MNSLKGKLVFDSNESIEGNYNIEVNSENNYSSNGSRDFGSSIEIDIEQDFDVINIILVYAIINMNNKGQVEVRTQSLHTAYDEYYEDEFYKQTKDELLQLIDEKDGEFIVKDSIKILSIVNDVKAKVESNDRYSDSSSVNISIEVYEL